MNPIQKFLPVLVYGVDNCPQNKTEWEIASKKLNCTSDELLNRYHCVPDHYKSSLLEFCYDANRILLNPGYCVEVNVGRTFTLDSYKCNEFRSGCPEKHFFSDETYKYPNCTAINTESRCFIAEANCKLIASTYTTKARGSSTEIITIPITHPSDTSYPSSGYVGWILLACVIVFVVLGLLFWQLIKKRRRGADRRPQIQVDDENQNDAERIPLAAETAQSSLSETKAKFSFASSSSGASHPHISQTEISTVDMERTTNEGHHQILEVPKSAPSFERSQSAGSGIVFKIDDETNDSEGIRTEYKSKQRILLSQSRNGFKALQKIHSEPDIGKRKKVHVGHDKAIIAAIDIGTTYSGYGLSSNEHFKENPLRIIVHKWREESYKTPTRILLNKNKEFQAFGYEAQKMYSKLADEENHKDYFYFNNIKMDLASVDPKLIPFAERVTIKDVNGKSESAMRIFTLAITYLKDHMLEYLSNKDIPVSEKCIFWVLTVPAIWDYNLKEFVRLAAKKALRNEILITDEANAVSFYCSYLPLAKIEGADIKSFKPGSRYLVLDAGGGTVDTTVHEVKFDGTLKELSKSAGGNFGGKSVNDSFKSLLEEIVGKEFLEDYHQSDTAEYIELFQTFEAKKREVVDESSGFIVIRMSVSLSRKYESIKKQSIVDRIRDTKYCNQIQWNMDKLKIKKELFLTFYDTCFKGIVKLVRDMLENESVKETKNIVMVGGFSESPLLIYKIQQSFPGCNVITPHEPGLSVIKGAVLFGHQPHAFSIGKLAMALRSNSF